MLGRGGVGARRLLPASAAASVRTGERGEVAQREDPEKHHFT
jgi:hypothetical protein